jgi:hypothetical protein
MKKYIKNHLRRIFPCTLILKAWFNAWKDSILQVRDSYSQTGEDRMILDMINSKSVGSRTYVDVGANHPTKLSNTYLLYRHGYRGVVVEPNRNLMGMHRKIRPEDIHLGIGCGEQPAVLSFQHATSHVLSGFQSEGLKASSFRGTELIPVLPLDLVLKEVNFPEITVLSIDVEGFDLQVVLGAEETLKRTRFVVIEGDETDAKLMESFKKSSFSLIEKTKHNLIFERAS